MGASCGVGHDGDPGVFPEWMVVWERLDAEDVERRGIDVAGIDGGDEILIDDMLTSGEIDDRGAFGQLCKICRLNDVGGFRRHRQHVDQDIGPVEKCLQLIRPVKAVHPRFRPGRSGPAGDRKIRVA